MLLSNTRLIVTPVMSLQTGGELARTNSAVIDPRDLSVLAFELTGSLLNEHPSFLRVIDVRELSHLGFIVDSSDEFIGLEDVIKIKEVHDFQFELIGKQVIDQKKHKLGKITGYSVEPETFTVVQLNVKRPLLKSFTDTELIIHRTQIVEVSDDYIVIKNDERAHIPVKGSAHSYTNPFRGTRVQPEAVQSNQSA